MTIRQAANDYKEEIREGIAYVAIWQIHQSGRRNGWCARALWPDGAMDGGEPIFQAEAISVLEDILRFDHDAVLLNGYYHGWFRKYTIDDIASAFKAHYVEGNFRIADALETKGASREQ